MGIADIFRNVLHVAPAPGTAPAQPTVLKQTELPGAPQTQADPNNKTAPAATPAPAPTPEAKYEKLWDTPPTNNDINAPIFEGLDPAKLQEAAAKMNFTGVLTPDLKQKLASGGEEAVNATMQALNLVAQGSYAQSAAATTQIVEKALQKQQERFLAHLPTLIKEAQVSDSLVASNPAFANPAIAPVVTALKKQLTSQHPTATPSEITGMMKEYLGIFGKLNTVLTDSSATPGTKPRKTDQVDWDAFLNEG